MPNDERTHASVNKNGWFVQDCEPSSRTWVGPCRIESRRHAHGLVRAGLRAVVTHMGWPVQY